MNTVRRRVAVLLVALLGAGGSLVSTGPAAAAPAPGTVRSHVSVDLPPFLAQRATAERIEYVSTDVNGRTIPATGLVLTPTKRKDNKIVGGGTGRPAWPTSAHHPQLCRVLGGGQAAVAGCWTVDGRWPRRTTPVSARHSRIRTSSVPARARPYRQRESDPQSASEPVNAIRR
jgi:hypothetical protein